MFKTVSSSKFDKQIEKLDKSASNMIVRCIKKNLEGCANLRVKGKQMPTNHGDKWRYRIGNYRLIVRIYDDKLLVLALCVGHWKDIYSTL